MARRRPLLRKEIEEAYANSRSATEAARYLHVNIATFRKYAQLYNMYRTNQYAIGIPKLRIRGHHFSSLETILSGARPTYDLRRLKERLLRAALIETKCGLCGFDDARPDGKQPTVLYFKDGDTKNFHLDNLELRCYNCMFLTVGSIHLRDTDRTPSAYVVDKELKFQLSRPMLEDDAEFSGLTAADLDSIKKEVLEEIDKDS